MERAKEQLAEYRRFRDLVREPIVVSEQICSAQVRDADAGPASEAKKNLLAGLLAIDVVQEIETLLGRQVLENLDLEALELAVRQQVLQLAGRAVEQRINADLSDARGARLACPCGKKARYAAANK